MVLSGTAEEISAALKHFKVLRVRDRHGLESVRCHLDDGAECWYNMYLGHRLSEQLAERAPLTVLKQKPGAATDFTSKDRVPPEIKPEHLAVGDTVTLLLTEAYTNSTGLKQLTGIVSDIVPSVNDFQRVIFGRGMGAERLSVHFNAIERIENCVSQKIPADHPFLAVVWDLVDGEYKDPVEAIVQLDPEYSIFRTLTPVHGAFTHDADRIKFLSMVPYRNVRWAAPK